MPMAVFDGYGFVIRERALTAFFIFANHLLVMRNIPQLADFEDGDGDFFPFVITAFNVNSEFLVAD